MSGAIRVESIRTRIAVSVRLITWWAPSLPRGKQTASPLSQRLLAFRSAKRGLSVHDDQPLFVRMMRVVRPESVADVELVHAPADQFCTDTLANPGIPAAPALAVLGAIPLVAVEVEDPHARQPTPRHESKKLLRASARRRLTVG